MAVGELAYTLMKFALVFVAFDALVLIVQLVQNRWVRAIVILAVGMLTLFWCYVCLAYLLAGGHGSPSRDGEALVYSVLALGLQIATLIGFAIASRMVKSIPAK